VRVEREPHAVSAELAIVTFVRGGSIFPVPARPRDRSPINGRAMSEAG